MNSTGYEGRFYTGFGGVFVHRIRRSICTQDKKDYLYTGLGGVFVHRIRRVIYKQEDENDKVRKPLLRD